MRTVGRRSIVLYILLILFFVGVGYMCAKIFFNGPNYITQAYNGHIYADDATAVTGNIYDRNGNLLATTINGERIYNDDATIRRAMLHTVGDSSGYIGTSVQALLRSKLMGYNIVTGLNRTPIQDAGLNNVNLSLDSGLCAKALGSLGGNNGAILISNYKTGELICKVSAPNYDPGIVPDDLLENDYYNGVLVDNTVSSSYTPGSIFKIVTATCAMDYFSDWETRTYYCAQSTSYEDGDVTCLGYHGELNMASAMMNSCNCYFAELAVDLGPEKMMKTAEKLGFNKSLVFSEFTTGDSELNLEKGMRTYDLAWAGVGQYTALVNPMHYLCLVSAIANGGSYVEPTVTGQSLFSLVTRKTTNLMDSSTANNLKDIMRQDVEYYYADYLFPYDWQVCAKTGTAEVGNGQSPNSWIVGFSSNPSYPYAFVVCVEHGGSGLDVAGNIASYLLGQLSY